MSMRIPFFAWASSIAPRRSPAAVTEPARSRSRRVKPHPHPIITIASSKDSVLRRRSEFTRGVQCAGNASPSQRWHVEHEVAVIVRQKAPAWPVVSLEIWQGSQARAPTQRPYDHKLRTNREISWIGRNANRTILCLFADAQPVG